MSDPVHMQLLADIRAAWIDYKRVNSLRGKKADQMAHAFVIGARAGRMTANVEDERTKGVSRLDPLCYFVGIKGAAELERERE